MLLMICCRLPTILALVRYSIPVRFGQPLVLLEVYRDEVLVSLSFRILKCLNMQIVDRETQLATYFLLADNKGSAILKSIHGLYDLNISN